MRHLYGLDILRFLSAFVVVVYHHSYFGWAAPDAWALDDGVRAFPWLTPVASSGWIGVQVFFVLSGFIISASAMRGSWFDFLKRRAVRVFPALWACVMIAFVVRLWAGDPADQLLLALFKSAFLSPVGPYIDGVVWTLVVEAVFYVFIAAVILISGIAENRQPFLDKAAIALGGISAIFITIEFLSPMINASFQALMGEYFFTVLMFRHGVFFAVGMLLWSIHSHAEHKSHKWLAAGILSVFCLLQIWTRNAGGAIDAVGPILLWSTGLLVMVASLKWREQIDFGTHGGVVRHLGLMTYPLYLNHYTLGTYLTPALFISFGEHAAATWIALCAITAGSSWMVMKWIEPWGQQRLKGALDRL